MTFQRFELLNRCFQINSTRNTTSYIKVVYLLKAFSRFKEIYKSSSKIALDEITSPFSGRFKHKVYNKSKPDKWGIKIMALADSITSFCLSIVPCFGDETYTAYKAKTLDDLILTMIDELDIRQGDLYMDNFYCHPNLAAKLKAKRFNTTGTVRLNRKDLPLMMKEEKTKRVVVSKNEGLKPSTSICNNVATSLESKESPKRKSPRGKSPSNPKKDSKKDSKKPKKENASGGKENSDSKESKGQNNVQLKLKKPKVLPSNPIRYFKCEDIYAVKWKDKKVLSVITTLHSIKFEKRLSSRKRETSRPIAAHEYNKYMRGVDILNQRIYHIK